MPVIRPPALKPGDAFGLIAPASPFERSRFDEGVSLLKSLDYRVFYSGGIFDSDGYLAGSDDRRLKEIDEAVTDPEIKAIFPVRGGYGAMRLLGRVRYETIAAKPKIWLGFSDISALQLAIFSKTGLITFHSPNLGSLPEAPPEYRERFFRLIGGSDPPELLFPEAGECWVPGKAAGRLYPANLSLITRLIGTPYLPDMDGAVLAIEDSGEAAYRIDRMLTHLELAGLFDRISGILAGHFSIGDEDKELFGQEVKARLVELAGCYGLPLIGGLPFGHEAENTTLPVGAMIEMDAEAGQVRLLEALLS